jgi:mannan endo-1,4-beta-mannosidase
LQKLDKVVDLAAKHGLYVLLSLTNNWNPNSGIGQSLPANVTPTTAATQNTTEARNALSNDYGGMDAYVRVAIRWKATI